MLAGPLQSSSQGCSAEEFPNELLNIRKSTVLLINRNLKYLPEVRKWNQRGAHPELCCCRGITGFKICKFQELPLSALGTGMKGEAL
jgi:hypothetical protein